MKKQLTLALLMAAAPFAASAGELSYSYLEGGVARADAEVGAGLDDANLVGGFLHGSIELGDSFHLFGGYESGTDDGILAGADIDLTQVQFGLGYHHGLSDRADLLAEVSYISQEVEVDAFGFSDSEDADGYRVSAGVRGQLSEQFEGLAKANYTDGDGDGEFSATLGGQWKFNPTWGLVGEVELGSDVTKGLLGVRASF